jgi:RND family efflux transporter MFP subunit
MSNSVAQTWLEHKVANRPDVQSALLLLQQNGHLEQAAAWPKAEKPDAGLVVIAKEAYRKSESVAWVDSPGGYKGPDRRQIQRLESRPLLRNGKVVGSMALLLLPGADSSNSEKTPEEAPTILQPPINAAQRVDLTNKHGASLSESKALNILQMVATVLGKEDFSEAITEVATELASAFDCDRVSIGLTKGRFNEVLAVSHSAEIQPTHSLLQLLAAAMDESVDQCEVVQYPPLQDNVHQIILSHAELANRHNVQQLLTIPMMREQTIIGAMVFERRDLEPFTTEQIDLLGNLSATLGPVLELKRDREHSWFARLKADINGIRQKLFAQEGRAMRATMAIIIASILALPLIPIKYSLNAPARLEGISQRVMVAPSDGFLRSASVRPGDLVKAGQVLAEMADEDLRQERRRWESEVLRHDSAFGDALKRRDRAQMASTQAQASEARAQLNLAEQQIERTRITAPFNGVVLKGDLKQQIGAPFKRGDTLLVLAPANEYRVIVSVEDRAIESVAKGARGNLLLTAMPDTALPMTVERVLPVANAQDGRNAFEVEAKLNNNTVALRPGMEGVAKIESGERSLYWMLGHRLSDWVKLTFWSWTH